MEMRAGGAAGRSHRADDLALRDLLAELHVKPRHVEIDRREPVAVIDHHRAAGHEETLFGERHRTRGRSLDRGAGGCGDIDAHMRRARLAVQDGLAAVDAADRPGHRPDETGFEEAQIAVDGARRRRLAVLALDAFEQLGAGRNLFLRQAFDVADGVLPRRYGEIAVFLAAVAVGDVERGMIRRVAAEAEDEMPVGRDAQLFAVEAHPRAGRNRAADQAALFKRPVEGECAGKGRNGEQQDRGER